MLQISLQCPTAHSYNVTNILEVRVGTYFCLGTFALSTFVLISLQALGTYEFEIAKVHSW